MKIAFQFNEQSIDICRTDPVLSMAVITAVLAVAVIFMDWYDYCNQDDDAACEQWEYTIWQTEKHGQKGGLAEQEGLSGRQRKCAIVVGCCC